MEYQDIVTAYKDKGLNITDLKKKLEVAKPLKGRPKYRAITLSDFSIEFNNSVLDILMITESQDKVDIFNEEIAIQLNKYFAYLITSIKECKAWKIIGLKATDFSLEKFEKLTIEKKFKILFYINKKYCDFLEYQKLADLRDSLNFGKELTDEKIYKIMFLKEMFSSLKNEDIKKEFFCFDKDFLMALIAFKKSRVLRMEEFMKTRKKTVQLDYEKYSLYFKNEDYRDIIENLLLTTKTLKMSMYTVIEAFSNLSETEAEQSYIKDDIKDLKSLENKTLKMLGLELLRKKNIAKELIARQLINKSKIVKPVERKQEKIKSIEISEVDLKQKELKDLAVKELNEKEFELNELESRILELKDFEEDKRKVTEVVQEEKIKEEIIKEDNPIVEETEKAEVIVKKNGKVQVTPLIFSWFEREDVTLARRITLKKLIAFFEKIKKIQEDTNSRVSLYLVTNTDKEVTIRRMQEIQKRARTQGLPNLVEGALGAYSSFKIDSMGEITDISEMSQLNRTKIAQLLDRPVKYYLPEDIIVKDETNYLRYQFSDRKNKSITNQYLKSVINHLLTDEKIKKQPLRFLPYMERNCAGIDVVLKSQLKGITQLSEYYKSKYDILAGATVKVNIDTIDSFIGIVDED